MNKYQNAFNELNTINTLIEKNLNYIDRVERGFISQNILAHLRNFIEALAFYYYCKHVNSDLDYKYEYIKNDIFQYCKTDMKLQIIDRFHNLLQMTTSHYTQSEKESGTLMLKYLSYLIEIKDLIKETDDIDILSNLENFPTDLDKSLKEYYKAINNQFQYYMDYVPFQNKEDVQRCYIIKCTPILINGHKIYEVILTPANDFVSKFDRIIAFTRFYIPTNYAIRVDIITAYIHVLENTIPISLIMGFEVSIRPCEFNNYAKIIGLDTKVDARHREYKNIMKIMTENHINLLSIIDMCDDEYKKVINKISEDAQTTYIANILNKSRDIINAKKAGTNILRYLIYTMINRVIKKQYYSSNQKLSELCLDNKCIPFDTMPFCSSLVQHTPSINTLIACFDYKNHKCELLAKKLIDIIEEKGHIYCNSNDFKEFKEIDKLIEQYNDKLYLPNHEGRKIEKFNNYYFIKEYEDNSKTVFDRLLKLTKRDNRCYHEKIVSWLLDNDEVKFLAEEKIEILSHLFEKGSLAVIYGAAGTGKSTLINSISNCFEGYKKIYLTNTHAALLNLKNKLTIKDGIFKTLKKVKREHEKCNILFIDECSTISNADMALVLKYIIFDVAIFVGDNYQIESIKFGNWFNIAKNILPNTSWKELLNTFRTNDKNILNFWNSVRNIDDDILDKMIAYGYKSEIDDSIFLKKAEDEIILCLNYDGLYGINNINRMLQSRNKEKEHKLGIHIFKIGDPILFNETKNFEPAITNNLKGKILNIEESDSKMTFTIQIYKKISNIEAVNSNLEYIASNEKHSIIKLNISRQENSDNDSSKESVMPFQIAYAVSIHKSQGLEFDSVKIIVSNQRDESITHNVFYTAVTRTRKYLKIYWSEEVANLVIANLKRVSNMSDLLIFGNKNNYKINKKV